MLHYLDIEEILKLYSQNHEHTVGRRFETRQALDTLSQRCKLPKVNNFKQLLQNYDMLYATVRSYLYDNRSPLQILLEAAYRGNIQAFYNQLKMYPELRKEGLYNTALARAAGGGHEAIMELLFDLGAEDADKSVFINAAFGGHVAIVQKELAKGVESKYIEAILRLITNYRHKAVVVALLDYSTTDKILSEAVGGAGTSGDVNMIEYIISRGGKDYLSLIEGAAIRGHFDIVRQYWDKLGKTTTETNNTILNLAARFHDLAMIKLLVERQLVSQEELKYNLGNVKYFRKEPLKDLKRTSKPKTQLYSDIAAMDSIIAYLESMGIEAEEESTSESSSD